MKGHWWSLTLSWPDDDQGMISITHDIFIKKMRKIHRFIASCFFWIEIDLHTCFIRTTCITIYYYMLSLSICFPCIVYDFSYLSLSTWFAHPPIVSFLQASRHPFVSNDSGQNLPFLVVLWLGSYAEVVSTGFVKTLNFFFSFVLYLCFIFD